MRWLILASCLVSAGVREAPVPGGVPCAELPRLERSVTAAAEARSAAWRAERAAEGRLVAARRERDEQVVVDRLGGHWYVVLGEGRWDFEGRVAAEARAAELRAGLPATPEVEAAGRESARAALVLEAAESELTERRQALSTAESACRDWLRAHASDTLASIERLESEVERWRAGLSDATSDAERIVAARRLAAAQLELREAWRPLREPGEVASGAAPDR